MTSNADQYSPSKNGELGRAIRKRFVQVILQMLIMTAIIQFFVYPGAWSTHLLWASALAFIMFRGPGQLSIDHWLRTRLM